MKLARRRWLWALVTLGAALVIALAIVASTVPLRSESLRKRIVAALSDQLGSEVVLRDISLRLYPRLHVEGKGLTVRQRGRTGVPPLIEIEKFSVDADMAGLVRKRVARVQLAGLVISIPPDDDRPETRQDGRKPEAGPEPDARSEGGPLGLGAEVVIERLETRDARLVIIPAKAGKEPKTWAIHTLAMKNVGAWQSMPFDATLTNAVPPGEIVTVGRFGPWDRDNPGDTPLDGNFTFDRANLDVFDGIGGTLSSRGRFGGSLNWIDVTGETDTPDFVLDISGHPFRLQTKYHTVVDGTNGDTRLEQIDARFMQSTLVAKGAVLDAPPGQHGRTVTLDVTMADARIEDVMRMAVKAPMPPMIGGLQLTTKFLLPPGKGDVADRLQLDGRFAIARAKFTNFDVQGKIVELSHRGRGRKTAAKKEQVASDFRGRFVLRNGRLALNDLMFAVPGAQVRLAGNYALKPETLSFKGNLFMDAKVSETVDGFKSLLLKIADPLFRRKGGGSEIPIKIEGTRDDPKFGLDMGRVFNRGN